MRNPPFLFAPPAFGHLALAAVLSVVHKIKTMQGKMDESEAVKREKCNFRVLLKGKFSQRGFKK